MIDGDQYLAADGPVPVHGVLSWHHTPVEGGELIERTLKIYLNGHEEHPVLVWTGKEIDEWLVKIGWRVAPDA